jgi:DNA-binding NarL/FixJ family response regulator
LTCLVAGAESIGRAGLRFVVESQPDLVVMAEAWDVEQAIDLADAGHPDVILLDVRLLGVDGIGVTRALLRAAAGSGGSPSAVIILIGAEDEAADDARAIACLRAGARGVLLRTSRPEALLSAIRTAVSGQAVLDPGLTRRLVSRSTDSLVAMASTTQMNGNALRRALRSLSPREREVLAGLARGRSNRQLSKDFGLREATVKSHVSRLLSKLGVHSRTEAIVLAYQTGLVATPDAVAEGS